jgi:hypothetical protein
LGAGVNAGPFFYILFVLNSARVFVSFLQKNGIAPMIGPSDLKKMQEYMAKSTAPTKPSTKPAKMTAARPPTMPVKSGVKK